MTYEQIYTYLVNERSFTRQRAMSAISWARDASIVPVDRCTGITYDHDTGLYEIVNDEKAREQIAALYELRQKQREGTL